MEMLHGFPEWAVAVIEHWHGWVSGGVLAFGLELGDKLWDWKPKRPVLIAIIGTGLLWSVFAAWRDEHHNTEVVIGEKAAVWSQYNQCDKERAINDSLAKSCSGSLIYQQSRNDGQQDLFNKCLLSLGVTNKPTALKIEAKWAWAPINGTNGHAAAILALTNQRTPVNIHLKCDKQFQYLGASIDGATYIAERGSGNTSDHEANIDNDLNSWGPNNPLVIFVASTVNTSHLCEIVPR